MDSDGALGYEQFAQTFSRRLAVAGLADWGSSRAGRCRAGNPTQNRHVGRRPRDLIAGFRLQARAGAANREFVLFHLKGGKRCTRGAGSPQPTSRDRLARGVRIPDGRRRST
jgi:hypothetical protein